MWHMRMRWKIKQFHTLYAVCCLSLACTSTAASIEKIDLFVVGDDPAYARYHIPGVTVTSKGMPKAIGRISTSCCVAQRMVAKPGAKQRGLQNLTVKKEKTLRPSDWALIRTGSPSIIRC